MKKMVVVVFALFASAAATAGEFRFDYTGEELASHAGIEDLHDRLARTAGRYCEAQFDRRIREVRVCRETIVEEAIRQIDSPRLTAYRTGDSQPTS